MSDTTNIQIGIDTQGILSPSAGDIFLVAEKSGEDYFWRDITFSDFKAAVLGGVDIAALKTNFDSHVANGSAHHTRYTDEEAVTAIKNDPDWNSGDVTDLSEHSVTELNDVTHAGSGEIISTTEREDLEKIQQFFDFVTVTDGQDYIRAKVPFRGDYEITAYSSGDDTGTIWDDMPVATATSLGGVKVDDTISDIYLDSNNVLQVDFSNVSTDNFYVNDVSFSNETLTLTRNDNTTLSTTIKTGPWSEISGGIEYNNNVQIGGNITISGDIIQNGDTYETHAEQLYTTKDFIITREEATAAIASGEISGLGVTKYDGTNNLIFGTDSNGFFKVGEVGDLQTLTTRPDSITDNYIARWDDTNNRLKFVESISENDISDLQNYALDSDLSNHLSDTDNPHSTKLDDLDGYTTNNTIEIVKTSNGDGLRIGGRNLDVDLHLGDNNNWDEYGFYWRYKGSGTGNDNDLELWAQNQGGTHQQVYNIKQDGNIDFLQILSEQGDRVATRNWSTLQNVTDQGNTTDNIIQVAGSYSTPSGKGIEMSYNNEIGYIRAYDRDLSEHLELRIDGDPILLRNGNVGIGTTTPTEALDVNGNISIADGGGYIKGESWQMGMNYSDYIFFRDGTNTSTVRIYPDSGDIWAERNITAEGEITAYSSSDIYLKQDIQKFSAMDLINGMNPVTYRWNEKAKELNNNKDDRQNYGLIAQELEEIAPELIHSVYTDYKAIDYEQIISILIQNNKEQNEKIKELEKKINK